MSHQKHSQRVAMSVPTVASKKAAVRNCQWMLLGACIILVLVGFYWPAALATMLSVGFSIGSWVQRWIDSGKHIG